MHHLKLLNRIHLLNEHKLLYVEILFCCCSLLQQSSKFSVQFTIYVIIDITIVVIPYVAIIIIYGYHYRYYFLSDDCLSWFYSPLLFYLRYHGYYFYRYSLYFYYYDDLWLSLSNIALILTTAYHYFPKTYSFTSSISINSFTLFKIQFLGSLCQLHFRILLHQTCSTI